MSDRPDLEETLEEQVARLIEMFRLEYEVLQPNMDFATFVMGRANSLRRKSEPLRIEGP